MAIDWKHLANDVRFERHRRGIGVRQAAKEIAISPATVSRIENRKPMTAEGFMLICRWLKSDPLFYSDEDVEF